MAKKEKQGKTEVAVAQDEEAVGANPGGDTPLPSSTWLQTQNLMIGLSHRKLIAGLYSPFFDMLILLVNPLVSTGLKLNSHATFLVGFINAVLNSLYGRRQI
jgi:hypothetical protein